MKKTTLKFIFSALFAVLLLSSCLSDNENSIQQTNSFSFISETNSVRYAAAYYNGGILLITSDEIKNMNVNDCYFLSYKVNFANAGNGAILKAENVVPSSSYPIAQTTLSTRTPEELPNGISAKALQSNVTFVPVNYQGDRWLFSYNVMLKEDEKSAMYFYYDANRQVDQAGNAVGKNRIVVDVRFAKTVAKPESTANAVDIPVLGVGNLSALRNAGVVDYTGIEASSDGNKYVNVVIQFRYLKYVDAENPAVETYMGSATTDGGNVYYMLFSNSN